jgi:hypothetical protein
MLLIISIGLLSSGFDVYCASRNMRSMHSLVRNEKCHFIAVDLDDQTSVRNALSKTSAGSIFLVTTTDFSYPTDTTFVHTRSFKEAEDLECATICRVCICCNDNKIEFIFTFLNELIIKHIAFTVF